MAEIEKKKTTKKKAAPVKAKKAASKVEKEEKKPNEKPAEAAKAVETKDETLASKEETSSVDALVEADKEEKDTKPEEEHKIEAADPVEQALKEAAASDAAQEVNENAEKGPEAQTQAMKNIFEPLKQIDFSGKTCEEMIEEKRSLFANDMKKSRTLSTVTMSILLVCIIGGYLLNMYTTLTWLVYTIFGIAIVFVIAALIYSSRQRKKLYASVDVFVKDAMVIVDSYVFSDGEFSNTQVSRSGHVELETVTSAHYFDTINAVNSRNIVKTIFMNKELQVAEIAARVPYQAPNDGKDHTNDDPKKKAKESYGIFGKYLSYPIALKEGAAVIITMKGTNGYTPTYLDGYQKVEAPSLNSSFDVYTTNPLVCEDMIKAEGFADTLNTFSSDANLENMFLSINPHGLSICLNYNESVMEVPMEKKVYGTPYTHYRDDIQKAKKLIKAISAE